MPRKHAVVQGSDRRLEDGPGERENTNGHRTNYKQMARTQTSGVPSPAPGVCVWLSLSLFRMLCLCVSLFALIFLWLDL